VAESKIDRRVFWHNYRLLRVAMRGASPETWGNMKVVAKVGLFGLLPYHLAIIASKGLPIGMPITPGPAH
jgi:hypothetical protein